MQHYLLDNDPSGAYSAVALNSAQGFDVDFTVKAGQQVAVSAQLADQYGVSPLSITVYNPLGGMVSTSQPYGFSYGTELGTGAEFVASTSGLYTATVKGTGTYTTPRAVAVSVTNEACRPCISTTSTPSSPGPRLSRGPTRRAIKPAQATGRATPAR